MIRYTRHVRFEEVDAAGILFFARYLSYAHEAMEHFFVGLPGGYPGLIVGRHTGFPAVHVETDHRAPLRYGDVVTIETRCARLGRRSAVLEYVFLRGDGVVAAVVRHTVVVSDLRTLTSIDMPADVRAAFVARLSEE